MARGPFVLRDLSACCHDRRAGAEEPARVRAMRVLVAHEDPERNGGIRRHVYPQTPTGCLAAAQCGL